MDRFGIALRPERPDDAAFVRGLYHQGRAEETAAAGWPTAAALAFLDEQLRLQTAHFVANHPDAERQIITVSGATGALPIGRCYVDRNGQGWRVLEIGLLDEWQGRGIGAGLIASIQRQVVDTGAEALALNVLRSNTRAASLYARLGFVETASLVVSHRAMIWRPRT